MNTSKEHQEMIIQTIKNKCLNNIQHIHSSRFGYCDNDDESRGEERDHSVRCAIDEMNAEIKAYKEKVKAYLEIKTLIPKIEISETNTIQFALDKLNFNDLKQKYNNGGYINNETLLKLITQCVKTGFKFGTKFKK